MRILVTGANGDIGEAVGRILQSEFPDAIVTGSDCSGQWPGAFVFKQMIALPPAADHGYAKALVSAVSHFDLVIPTSEPELAYLAADADTARAVPLLMAPPRIVSTFMDKYATAQFFSREKIPGPRTWLASEAPQSALPLYLKPRRGAGGRGHRRVDTAGELSTAAVELGDRWVLQEFLGGGANEYTCALMRVAGITRHLVMRRKLQGDRTVIAEVQNVPAIASLLERLATLIDLDGCINVQLKLTTEGPRIFEINPRLSSTVMMRHRMGFADCAWWVRHRLGLPIQDYVSPAEGTVAYRMSTEHVRSPRA